ncbi:MAG: dienelactone hydrolase family protein [Deltaproteobacteria bacterium]|nr:dienelactone hydrolase family protein [Deltaproteobacteria bacterium]
MGSIIEFEGDGQTFQGYLASADMSNAPGVIVVQEWWGLVDHVKDLCDRMAAEGFNALAPDLYAGRSTTRPDEAGKLMMALDIARTEVAMRGAIAHLLAAPGTRPGPVGVVGFCMGGQLALFAAAENPTVGAAVDFYGIHPAVTVDVAKVSGPVLAFFAEHDGFVDAAAMVGLVQRFADAGKRLEVHRYLDADHAFMNDTRPEVYHPAHARDAWARTVAFLHQYLGQTR